jgi:hypothetical protein
MFVNYRAGRKNTRRPIQGQSARSKKSLASMRANAIELHKAALSDDQFRESHRQYILRHSNEHPDESVLDMNIRLAADVQRRARNNAEFNRSRSRSRDRERNRTSSRTTMKVKGLTFLIP